jgi:hypothetical protein
LRAGEIRRVHRALCMEAGFAAAAGTRARARTVRILQTTEQLAARIDTPYARGLHLLIKGVSDYLVGHWQPALGALTEAERLFTDHCAGVTWELDSSRFFAVWNQYWLGQFKAFSARFPLLLKDAHDRGDLYASAMVGGHLAHFVFLSAGDPVAAWRHTHDAISKWSQSGFHMQHLWEMWSHGDIAIYERRGEAAWQNLTQRWPALERSLLLEVQLMRISMLELRARSAIAAAGEAHGAPERRRRLDDALWCAKAIERQRAAWGTVLAGIIRAGVDFSRGNQRAALARLNELQPTIDALDMAMIAAAIRRRRGELMGGQDGATLIADSEAWMRSEEVNDPVAMTFMLAPWKMP